MNAMGIDTQGNRESIGIRGRHRNRYPGSQRGYRNQESPSKAIPRGTERVSKRAEDIEIDTQGDWESIGTGERRRKRYPGELGEYRIKGNPSKSILCGIARVSKPNDPDEIDTHDIGGAGDGSLKTFIFYGAGQFKT